tara:strand:+ start:23 stop:865 length:843 start_codon:yes stop_codon:yes gene_type:complete
MAKKAKTKVSNQADPGDEHVEMVAPVMETPKPKVKVEPKKPTWEIKDRLYNLQGNKKPISRSIKASNVYWFDEEKGYERELKHTSNQKTPFVDEMKGDQRLEHIIFRSGSLFVPKEKTVLQKLLSLYHPHRNNLYYEHKPQVIAAEELDLLEMQADAIIAARTLDLDMAEAIMRVEIGSNVSNMSSKELKRDLLIYARNNPLLFLDLLEDDNIVLRNYGIKATEQGILRLSSDNRTFTWGSNGRKLLNVPFDEHPYSALAAWFKTDEGMEIYSNIEKQLQ